MQQVLRADFAQSAGARSCLCLSYNHNLQSIVGIADNNWGLLEIWAKETISLYIKFSPNAPSVLKWRHLIYIVCLTACYKGSRVLSSRTLTSDIKWYKDGDKLQTDKFNSSAFSAVPE